MTKVPEGWRHAAEQAPLLNERQKQVVELIERGCSNQEIADRLEVTLSGAKWHVSELLSLFGFFSREEMAEFWAWQRRRRAWWAPVASVLTARRWVGPVAAGVVAVAIGLPLLMLRSGGKETAAENELAAGTAPAATLSPSLSLATYPPEPFPAPGPMGRLAYINTGGALVVQSLPSGPVAVVRRAAPLASPRWSTSGNYLAFVESGVLVVLGEGKFQRVHAVDSDRAWAWSQEADVLALFSPDGLALYDARSGVATPIRGQGAPWPEAPGGVAWSPDGGQLLYATNTRSGPNGAIDGNELRVFDVSDGRDRLLLHEDIPAKGGTQVVGWSGDGRWVYYREAPFYGASVWVDGVPLWRIPVGGGTPEKMGTLLANDDLFAAREGSSQVAFIDGGGRFATEGSRSVTEADATLVAGGLRAGGGSVSAVAWSPRGNSLVLVEMPNPPAGVSGGVAALEALMGRKLWLVGPGGPPTQLTNHPDYRDEHPMWSNDGATLVFTRIDAAGKASLWMVAAGGGNPTQLLTDLSLGGTGPYAQSVSGPYAYYGWIEWGGFLDWWQP